MPWNSFSLFIVYNNFRSESENATPAPATTTTQPDEPEEEDDKGEATPAPVTPRYYLLNSDKFLLI